VAAHVPSSDSPTKRPRHLQAVAILAVLALTVGIRLPGIGRPLVGNFATKNVLYAMIARNWAEGRAPLWYPTLDCLTDGGRQMLYMQEFPASAYLTGWLWKQLGGSLDAWGRTTSIALVAASVAVLFGFVRRRHGASAGWAAAVALTIAPVSVIYGQAFLLQASVVFFMVAAMDRLDRWLASGRHVSLLLAAISLAMLLLTKIYMLVVLLPMAAYVASWARSAERRSMLPRLAAMALVTLAALVPAACWYSHAAEVSRPGGAYADRIYFSVWRSADAHGFPHPLLRSGDFYRQILDDLAGVVLTPVGFMLALVGLMDRTWRRHATWLAAMAMLILALPRKFYEMNYYYMAVVPPLCVMVGLGWQVVEQRIKPGRLATVGLLAAALVFSLRYAAKPAFVTPDEDRGVVAAGRAVQELTYDEEPVVTMHGSTFDLLYYCDRKGWFVDPDTDRLHAVLESYRRKGAAYLVVAGPEAIAPPAVLENHTIAVRGDGFVIRRLGR